MTAFMGGIFPQTLPEFVVTRPDTCSSPTRPEQYHYDVPEPAPSPEALTELLERFPLERPGSRTFEEVADAQVRFLTARIAALTDMLRGAEPNETVQLASRILLGDLTALSAHFRGRANTMRSSLGKVVADLRAARHASSHGERD